MTHATNLVNNVIDSELKLLELAAILSMAEKFYTAGSTQRHYHSWDGHILPHLQTLLDVSIELGCAWAFHDCIYMSELAASGANEMASAEIAKVIIGGYPKLKIDGDFVAQLILATRHTNPPKSPEEMLICDYDLYGLSAPYPQFLYNSFAISREYPQISLADFIAGRKVFFQNFLDTRSTIYHSSRFQHLNPVAVANITKFLTEN